MDSRHVAHSSLGFFLAARRCSEERRLGPNQVEVLMIPRIVCEAFSVELGLKALLLNARRTGSGHNLLTLFNQLEREVQDQLIALTPHPRAEFISELSGISSAFIQWRYVYEFPQLGINLLFLHEVAEGVQKLLEKLFGP